MRVLYLCHRLPYPPNKGDKIRAFHQLQAISTRHEVDVFTLVDDAADLDHVAPLKHFCRGLTVKRVYPKWAEVRQALSQCRYDVIFVYCSAMAQYVQSVSDIPIVMDLVDVDSDKWMQYAAHTRFPFSAVYRREGRTLQAFERSICERAAYVL